MRTSFGVAAILAVLLFAVTGASAQQVHSFQCMATVVAPGTSHVTMYVTQMIPMMTSDHAALNGAWAAYVKATYHLDNTGAAHCQRFGANNAVQEQALAAQESIWRNQGWEIVHVTWRPGQTGSSASAASLYSAAPGPGGVGAPAAAGTPAPPQGDQPSASYCFSDVRKPTIYFSEAFDTAGMPSSSPYSTAFTKFLAQKFKYTGAVTCKTTNTIFNAQSMYREQRDTLQNKQIVETDWTYEAAAASATPPAPATPAAAASTHATTTHNLTPAAASAAASALAATGQGTPYYCYISVVLAKHETRYTTGVFHSDESRAWIDFWWSEYIHSTYQITNPNLTVYCKALPAKPALQQSELDNNETSWKLHNYEIVHVDWKPTKTPPPGEYEPAGAEIAAGRRLNQPPTNPASAAPVATQVAATHPTHPEGGGGKYHYYCSSDMGQSTIYFSSAFDTDDTNPRPMEEGFKKFLEQKYSYKFPDQLPCFGNYKTLAEVQADAQKRMKDMSASGKWKVVETGWTWGGTPPPPPTPVPAGMNPNVAQLAEPYRGKAIQEASNTKSYCQNNAVLPNLLDCDCFSRLILNYRIAHASEYHAPQGGHDIGGWEPFTNLFLGEKLPCTECQDTARLTKYATDEARKSLSNVIAQKGASDPSVTNTINCDVTKFLADFRARPYLGEAQGILRNAFSTCYSKYGQ